MAGTPGSKAERAFALYAEMTAAERREYALLCRGRGFDAAGEGKQKPKPVPAAAGTTRTKAAGAGRKGEQRTIT